MNQLMKSLLEIADVLFRRMHDAQKRNEVTFRSIVEERRLVLDKPASQKRYTYAPVVVGGGLTPEAEALGMHRLIERASDRHWS